MPYYFIAFVVLLAIAHIMCDVNGVSMGKQLRWLFKPAVWFIYALTFGRVDLSQCKACREREAYLNKLFGDTLK